MYISNEGPPPLFFPISPHEILVRLSAHYSQMYDHYVELKKSIPMNIHHIRISNIEICVNVILKRVYVNIMMVQSFFPCGYGSWDNMNKFE